MLAPAVSPARLNSSRPATAGSLASARDPCWRPPAIPSSASNSVGVEAGHHIRAIREAAPQVAEQADAGVAPRGRHDHAVDECSLDAVERWRLVTFVHDADRHQHHAGAQVQTAIDQQINVGLLNRDLAGFFGALDKRVLDLDLGPELDAIGKAVPHHQHEAVEVNGGWQVLHLIEVHLHVAGKRWDAFARGCGRLCLSGCGTTGPQHQQQRSNRALPVDELI